MEANVSLAEFKNVAAGLLVSKARDGGRLFRWSLTIQHQNDCLTEKLQENNKETKAQYYDIS